MSVGLREQMVGAEPVYVQAPGIVADRRIRDALLGDSALTEVTRRWRELTMAIVGIGSIEPSDLLAESGNAFQPDEGTDAENDNSAEAGAGPAKPVRREAERCHKST